MADCEKLLEQSQTLFWWDNDDLLCRISGMSSLFKVINNSEGRYSQHNLL